MKLTKVIASTLIITSVLALNPIGASAEWKEDSIGKWYTEGNSWAKGWSMIDGEWYYFNDKGYMVKDKDVDGWYLDENGVGRQCIKVDGFEIEESTGTLAKCNLPNSFGSPSRKVIPLIIPKEIGGIEIKRIGGYAFYNCGNLGSIVIPDNVTSIGNYAFNQCYGLTNIIIPDSVTSMGSHVFVGCDKLTSISIPKNITVINEHMFEGCKALTNITFSDDTTSIERNAFEYCESLSNITIPNGITSITAWSFYDCSNLTNITLPDSVTRINEGAFGDCKNLTKITIEGDVTSIVTGSFQGCNQATFYVKSEAVKQLILKSGSKIDSSKIIVNPQVDTYTVVDKVLFVLRKLLDGVSDIKSKIHLMVSGDKHGDYNK